MYSKNYLKVINSNKSKLTYENALTSLAQWIEHSLQTEGSQVQFLVKGMYLGCRHIPSRGCAGDSISNSIPLPSSL